MKTPIRIPDNPSNATRKLASDANIPIIDAQEILDTLWDAEERQRRLDGLRRPQ